ncbi:MAG: TolC family protein [Phycisphaerae bacterium]|nr:TolC family protein [Phycisphaerae bacterium]
MWRDPQRFVLTQRNGETRGVSRRLGWCLCLLAFAAGCENALKKQDDAELQRTFDATLQREAGASALALGPEETRAPQSDVFEALKGRRAQLDAMGPQAKDAGPGLDVGPDLFDSKPGEVILTLQKAVSSAVENNLAVQQARLDEAISQTDIIRAEAVFDTVLFASGGYSRSNQPQPVLNTGGGGAILLNPSADQRNWTLTTGLQQQFATGTNVSISSSMGWLDVNDPGNTITPNPSYDTSVNLTLSQPLLKGFGLDVNLAQVRLAKNQDRRAVQAVRQQLLQTVSQVEAVYWQVYVQRQRLVSARWLLKVGEDVRDLLERRRGYDTTLAQYSDAISKVEDRRAQVIRAERELQRAVNALKQVMNEPLLPPGGNETIVIADSPVDQPLRYSMGDALATAMAQNPQIAAALLSINDASIGLDVAENGRLPQLDLQASGALYGLASGLSDSWGSLGDNDWIEYAIGATFRQPLGNRAAEAEYRRARLTRSRAVIGYRSAVQETVLAVRNALQDAAASYRLIGQTRAQRLAAAENMRALAIEEENVAQLTPEFLALKFLRQDSLAVTQLAEAAALADYNTAIANLYTAIGTGLERNRIEFKLVSVQPGG